MNADSVTMSPDVPLVRFCRMLEVTHEANIGSDSLQGWARGEQGDALAPAILDRGATSPLIKSLAGSSSMTQPCAVCVRHASKSEVLCQNVPETLCQLDPLP